MLSTKNVDNFRPEYMSAGDLLLLLRSTVFGDNKDDRPDRIVDAEQCRIKHR